MIDATETAHLVDAMRHADTDEAQVAERRLYQALFSNPLGRAVLMHLLAKNGVGAVRGPNRPGENRAYEDGRMDAALEIMNAAGFDQASAVGMVVTDNLEGQEHDDDRERDEPTIE